MANGKSHRALPHNTRQTTVHRYNNLILILILCIFSHTQCVVGITQLMSDVNVLVLTDVHSWVAGHRKHEPEYGADYGDVLSFYTRLKALFEMEERDLFFVMNGDFVDGTGLTTDPPVQLANILVQMPWDAINIGNHELYKNSTIKYITQPGGLVDSWEGKYITSNVLVRDHNSSISGEIQERPIGQRYKFLQGNFNSKTTLTFGFLYDMKNHCSMTEVETVESVVNSSWFTSVLNGDEGSFDAILVLAHMDVRDSLVRVILDKIRVLCGDDMPVQFITGHSHRRDYEVLDNRSTSFEGGRYLTTLGFVSFSLQDENVATEADSDQPLFQYEFIDPNVEKFKEILNVDTLDTVAGVALSTQIEDAQEELGLFELVGCPPRTYRLKSGLANNDSLWGLFANTIIPEQLFNENSTNKIYIQNSGSLRYDLFEGNTSLTDLISVSPYRDTIYLVDDDISGKEFVRAFGEPNYVDPDNSWFGLPGMVVSGKLEKRERYRVYAPEFDLSYVSERLEEVTGRILAPIEVEGNTTWTLWLAHFDKYWTCEYNDLHGTAEPDIVETRVRMILRRFSWLVAIGLAFIVALMLVLGCCFMHRNSPRSYTDASLMSSSDDESLWSESMGSDVQSHMRTPRGDFGLT